ncbi:MAG: ferrous iron transport protein B [Firmicutes bacterium]|nr:ferrous iron transport protein B [Candidatus Colimorpha enterica]
MTIKDLKAGQSAVITAVGGDGALRQHFLDMGVIPGTEVTVEKFAPMGDPMEIRVHDYELTLRLADAEHISVTTSKDVEALTHTVKKVTESHHPGLGESGKYHEKSTENPLPEGTVLTFALVGNQNCGKTTLFNQLTGSNQHVGNFPGVTVDRKDASIKGHPDTLVTDLPGIYSMSPYTVEEVVSRDFVLTEKPKAIINIIDATNIERNMYLTMQLLEMNIPMVIALNMMDEMTGNGGSVDINTMEALLGVPVVPISAAKNKGINELIDHAVHVAYYQEKPLRQDFCDESDHGGAVHRCLHAISHLIEDHAAAAGLPVRFAASKLVEGDHLIEEKLNLDPNEKDMLEHIKIQLESEVGLDCSSAIADMRYDFILKVCASAVKKPAESKERIRSRKIDKFLTGKYTAIPAFVVIMMTVFWLTFNVVGKFLQDLLAQGIDRLSVITENALISANANEVVRSLVIDGIFNGVGSVLSFLPVIVITFFLLTLLEASGYIARVAFFMDKLLRKIGLSGRSIVPLLIGFGCTVPAVMSTRTLPSERDRKMTVLLTPFMSCSAKLPIYSFLIATFFPGKGALVMGAVYFLGIAVGVLVALFMKGTFFKGEAVPFVMELPNYRLPSPKNVIRLLGEKAKDFIRKAFTVILVSTVVIWFLQSFDLHFNFAAKSGADSILQHVSSFLVPVFRPLGLGDARICTALISGFIAKESVVSTIEILFAGSFAEFFPSIASAVAMLVFCLLYTPCVAAVNSVKRELGWKTALGMVVWQCSIAWVLAYAAKLIFTTVL